MQHHDGLGGPSKRKLGKLKNQTGNEKKKDNDLKTLLTAFRHMLYANDDITSSNRESSPSSRSPLRWKKGDR